MEKDKKTSQVAGTTSEEKENKHCNSVEVEKGLIGTRITLNQARECVGLEKVEDTQMNQLLVKHNIISG
ncbi:hypothetical protein [Lysinibacillus sp. RC79]|uniref:hypothetical protein n=1 Tax=Lysinibacillus sp. RC79 TaxID=3156296 RepID=UPI0035180BAD